MIQNTKSSAAGIFSAPFSTAFLINKCHTPVFLPFYHLVCDSELPHIKNLYQYRNSKLFCEDLDFFSRHFTFVELKDIINFIKSGLPLPKNALHITFDDGLREVFDVAAPILKEKGIPATFFINSGFTDNKGLFYKYKASLVLEKISHAGETQLKKITGILKTEHDIKKAILSVDYRNKELLDEIAPVIDVDFNLFLKDQKPYLSSEQIRSLVSDGFTIGSHSIDHPDFSIIDKEEQIRQARESMEYLSKNFGITYRSFAFPFSDFKLIKDSMEEITALFDCSFGTSGINDDIYPSNLQRFEMEKTNLPARIIIRKRAAARRVKLLTGNKTLKR